MNWMPDSVQLTGDLHELIPVLLISHITFGEKGDEMILNRLKAWKGIVVTMLAVCMVVGMGMSHPLSAGDKKPTVIKVGTFGDPSTLKIGWAKGWFDEATGVQNKWATFDSGADVIEALTYCDLDISSLGSAPTTIGVARGAPFMVVAVEMDLADNEALIARPGITVVHDLIGKNIATPFGSTSHYALMRVLKVNNISPRQLTLVDMGSMEAAGAFKDGVIDGAWIWDPAYMAMIEAGGHIVMSSGDVGKMGYPTWNNIVVRKEFAETYPDVLVTWLSAFLKTVDFYHKNPQEAARIVAKRLGTKYESAFKMMKGFGFPSATEQLAPQWLGKPGQTGAVAKGIRDTSEFLVDQKIISTPLVMAVCCDAVDSSFLIRAMK